MKKLLAIATLLAVTACGTPNGGYYDANGTYVPPANATTDQQRIHSPSPGQSGYSDNYYRADRAAYTYQRPGYYDYKGYYMPMDSGLNVPRDMFPQRGMCRVWFPDREIANQPHIESCDGIQYRVPAGAYVIYGG